MRMLFNTRTQVTRISVALVALLGLGLGAAALQVNTTGPVAPVADRASGWELLSLARVTETVEGHNWYADKTFPPELVAARVDFEITGHLVLITTDPYVEQFLLAETPSDCPFCGGLDPYAPVLEVHMKRALPDVPNGIEISLRGQLELIEDPETLQMFRLHEAVALSPIP